MVSQNRSGLGWIHQKVPQLSEPLLDGQQLSIQAQGWCRALPFFFTHHDHRDALLRLRHLSVSHINSPSSCEHCDLAFTFCFHSILHSRVLTTLSTDAPTGPWGQNILAQYSHWEQSLQANCQGESKIQDKKTQQAVVQRDWALPSCQFY